MKKMLGLAVMATVLLGLATGCTKLDEDMQPIIGESGLRETVQGKWRIERVNNKLCRSGSCTAVVYNGTAEDYSQEQTFMLSNFGWAARFRVMHRDKHMLVLESTYAGSDPSAVFTDTYYLYR